MSEIAANPLVGARVLAVEDESIVAMFLEDSLHELGCTVIGPAARVKEALELIECNDITAAVLDINVAGEKVFPVADRLAARGIPFVFATGYGAAGLEEAHQSRLVLQKPYSTTALRTALEECLMGRSDAPFF